MNKQDIDNLVAEWDEVYKKGQLSLWVLLAIFDGEKYSQQINDFLYDVTDGTFEVQEQSLYRALRRFKNMGLVAITERDSPNSGPKRKYYSLTHEGEIVLGKFIALHIAPLMQPRIQTLLTHAQSKGEHNE